MQDYQSVNDEQSIPKRSTVQINPKIHNQRLISQVTKETKTNPDSTATTSVYTAIHGQKPVRESQAPGNAIIFVDAAKIIDGGDTPKRLVSKFPPTKLLKPAKSAYSEKTPSPHDSKNARKSAHRYIRSY